MKSKRFQVLAERPVNKDGFVAEWPEVGLIAVDSPNDPKPSIKIENGKIVEMDGKKREDFDMIEQFIADYAIDIEMAEKAMKMDSLDIAKMLVDVNVPREEVIKIASGLTPAKIVDVVKQLNVV
ncbi:propanediol/glycerol family dehydratase large subunit, partial [Thermovenabulum sp.]